MNRKDCSRCGEEGAACRPNVLCAECYGTKDTFIYSNARGYTKKAYFGRRKKKSFTRGFLRHYPQTKQGISTPPPAKQEECWHDDAPNYPDWLKAL